MFFNQFKYLLISVCLSGCGSDVQTVDKRPSGEQSPASNLGQNSLVGADLTSTDRLTIYVMPSTIGINWNSPSALFTTMILTQSLRAVGFTHSIGHLAVHLECEANAGRPAVDFMSGMTTTEGITEFKLAMFDKIGFGLFYYNFNGKLDDESDLRKEVANRLAARSIVPGTITFLAHQISRSTCARLNQYFTEYKTITPLYYGFQNRPRYKEGSGCAAFGYSFLEVAGIDIPEYQLGFKRSVNIPNALVGDKDKNIKIPFEKIREFKSWPTADTTPFTFVDPDLIYRWIENKLILPGNTYQKLQQDRKFGLLRDMRSVPTPTDSIFLESSNIVQGN